MKGKTLEVIDCPQLKGPPRKGDGRDITTIAWSVSVSFFKYKQIINFKKKTNRLMVK